MKLTDILAKAAKGETLTDEEKAFAGSYNPQTDIDAAAAAARKKADADAKAARDALAKLQGEFDDFRSENDPAKSQGETAKLLARIEKLEAAKKAAEDAKSAMERTSRVRSLAKDAGIVAVRGVDPSTIDMLVDNLMASVDLDDADAVKAAFDGFKGKNAGLIAADTTGGAGQRGVPGAGAFTGSNPFAKESLNLTEQMNMLNSNPQLARQLAESSGVKLGE